jgi:hypothetical protein
MDVEQFEAAIYDDDEIAARRLQARIDRMHQRTRLWGYVLWGCTAGLVGCLFAETIREYPRPIVVGVLIIIIVLTGNAAWTDTRSSK